MKFDVKKFDVKAVDKRVWIGAGVAVALILVFILVLLFTGDNKPANGTDSQAGTQTESQLDAEDGKPNDTSDDGLKDSEILDTEVGTEAGKEDATEDDVEGNTQNSENPSDSNDSDSTQSTVTNPSGNENVGAGNQSDPILVTIKEDCLVKTETINPGTTLYYGIYRVGGMCFTINNADAYVIYEGKQYDAVNGVVSFMVKNELASNAVYFEIGNKGTSACAFDISFAYEYGAYSYPEIIASMGSYTKSLEKGDELGHYYKYVAEKDGVIRFYISGTKDCDMSVTNLTTSVNRTFEDEEFVKTDAQGNSYFEVEVKKGEALMIQIFAKSDRRNNYPAVDITWTGQYV